MKGTTPKRRPRLSYVKAVDVPQVQRKLTLPPDLDKFLTDYAVSKGLPSEVQAVYDMIRAFKNGEVTKAATTG